MSFSQSFHHLVRVLQGKAGVQLKQMTLDLELSSHQESEQIPKEENSVKSTIHRANSSGRAEHSEASTTAAVTKPEYIRCFIFEGALWIRCIPAKTLFHSTTIYEVVNRGDFFACRVSDRRMTVLPRDADQLEVLIPVPNEVSLAK